MTEQLTYGMLGWPEQEAIMHALGYPEWEVRLYMHHTLEQRVVIAAVRAYHDHLTTGTISRGGVPKPKGPKQAAIDWAVWKALLDLAYPILMSRSRGTTEHATEMLIHDAWKATQS